MNIAKILGFVVLIFTFGEAALSKILGGEVPAWFLKQFDGSVLDHGILSLKIAFCMIALLETLTTLALVVSLVKPKFEQSSLILAQLTFFALMIGQRVTHNYSDAFQLFTYSFVVYFFSKVPTNARRSRNAN